MKKITKVSIVFVFFLSTVCVRAQTVSTLAGSTIGFADATGVAAQFNRPHGVAVDAMGNVYVADVFNHKIRKINPGGVVSTLAGSTDGFSDATGGAAQFSSPTGVAVDAMGNVYVADAGNSKIRKITSSGVVSTLAGSTAGFADGMGAAAQFNYPFGVAVDAVGTVYIADVNNHKIRKITSAGAVSTLAGSTAGFADGLGTGAQFNDPHGIAIDAGGTVYVADSANNRIRKITSGGLVSTLAGAVGGFLDGTGTAAQFTYPFGVAVDSGNNVYVVDTENYKIRKITPTGGVTTLAGSIMGFANGMGAVAKFDYSIGIAVDAQSDLYIGDNFNHKVRKINMPTLNTQDFDYSASLSVFPNPSEGVFTLDLKSEVNLEVFDMFGKQIFSKKTALGSTQLDLTEKSSGVYILKTTDANNKSQILKLIKRS